MIDLPGGRVTETNYAPRGAEDIGESEWVTVTVCASLEDESSVTGRRSDTWDGLHPRASRGWGWGQPRGGGTYSTCLDQGGGSLMVMNTQLVKMVIMMNMLNSVGGRVKEREGAGAGVDRGPSRPETPSFASP